MDTPEAKILIIEDDPGMLDLYKKVFEENKFTVFTADTGEEGVKIAKEQLPSLILLDVILPQMSGKHALRLLKSDPLTGEIPVIVLSNMDDSTVAKECMQIGAVDYITKGAIDINQLVAKVAPLMASPK